MAKISINLLPVEVRLKELKRAKFYKIQFIGVALILCLLFLTSLTFALQILQNRNVGFYKARLTLAEEKVSNFKDTQASLVVLKDRITVIDKYLGVPSKQSEMYLLINKLVPQSVEINAITVSKEGEVSFLALAPDFVSLDTLVNNLSLSEKNDEKISQVSIESLGRSKDGLYRVSLKVKPSK